MLFDLIQAANVAQHAKPVTLEDMPALLCCPGCDCTTRMGEGISLNDLIGALTDPNKRFEFPIKPWKTEIDLSTPTKMTIVGTGALILLAGYLASQRN